MVIFVDKITGADVEDFLNEEYSNTICENKKGILFINCNPNFSKRWFSVFNSKTRKEINTNEATGYRLTLDEAIKFYNDL